MTSLQITPSFTRKTAKVVGKVAAGEHVSVTVVGGNAVNTETLYLRIVCCGKTIAQFPAQESNDAWAPSGDDLTCVLNLNTVEALKFCRGPETGCLAVFEDLGDSDNGVHPQLYFVSDVIVNGWPQKRYGEEPYSLDAYPGLISRWETMISNLSASVSKVGKVATITIVNKDGTVTTAQVLDGETPKWSNLEGKPSVFPPSQHQHGVAEVTGLDDALAFKVSKSKFSAFGSISNPAASVNSLKTCLISVLDTLRGIST